MAVAAVGKAWDAFFSTTKVESEKDLAKLGWKSVRAIADDLKMTIASINSRTQTAVGKGTLETKKATIRTPQGIREVKLYRPISK